MFLFALNGQSKTAFTKSDKPNILFIGIDDLRPELGTYGSEISVSPNIDMLASDGIQFNRAYCQQAICGPSRASLLTGIRPQSSGIIHNYLKIRELMPEVVTLPQHFKQNGYEVIYYGKIFHHGDKDDDLSWSKIPAPIPDSIRATKGISGFAIKENRKLQEERRILLLGRSKTR